ncbi:double-stranded RNA-binding protein Staufen homolog 1 [Trichonephila inaurata madagascariensis]|uniref:Double-stranded RNA-binding protein Staufen homolog 1 n=1 Tax=Trichonephila inaurata madagascariensis TaxID=2747483 RepID=A0A8X6XV05_9ARAC|nr:double-stranded RNA-binding protein Staufen homolog 1 [Trichonephila inaurata madagascariensis]
MSEFPWEQKADPQYGQGINPISRLIQIQQAKKEREPVYTVIDERGEPRQREFIMQCSLGDLTTNGSGPNKKTAKRNAAEAMLQRMGYSRPIISPGKPTVKSPGLESPHMYQTQDSDKRKIYSDHEGEKLDNDGKMGRQLVPGLLLMPEASLSDQNNIQGYTLANSASLHRAPGGPIQVNKMLQTVAIIAKELLDTGISKTAEAIRKASMKTVTHQVMGGFKQKLLYLAEVVGFPVHFTDFPKGAKLEHICLVSVAINPNQVKHGAGATIEAAHDQAALGALRCLAELGMEAVQDGVKKENSNMSGDGLYITSGQGPAPKLANSPSTDLGSNPKTGSTIPITAKDSH